MFENYNIDFYANPFNWQRSFERFDRKETGWGYIYEWRWQFGPLVIAKWAVWERETTQ